MSITYRPPNPNDIPAIARVLFDGFGSIATAHNFPLDFPTIEHAMGLASAFTGKANFFGMLAVDGERVVGCNYLDRRNAIAAVGPICMDPAYQGKGIGRKLMQAVLDRSKQHPGVRLVQDAFNTRSMSLYASLGFETREPLALMRGTCKSAKISAALRPMAESDLAGCAALCKKIHGIERTGELRDAIAMLRPHVLEREGRIVAYASSPWMWFLNHGVAESENDMRDLLVGLSASSNDPMMMLVPTRQASLFRWLLAEKMQVVKPMTLMTMGFFQQPTSTYFPSVGY